MTILYFVIALGLLVFIHEFGHFIMAKKQGIGVEKFSLGFGPKLFSYRWGETTYLISALPLGGYVKLKGEDPEEEVEKKDESFSARPIRQRSLVVFAGPFMNLLLALVLMPAIFMIGRTEPIFLDQKPVVIGIRKDSPAEMIGLKKGDEILEINDVKISTWREFLDFTVLHGNEEVRVTFRRGPQTQTEKIVLAEAPETHAGMLGVEPSYFIGNEAIVDQMSPGSPAEQSGLKTGDEILEIDQVPVESWTDMSERVGASGGKKLAVTVRRNGKLLTVFLLPRYDESMKKWLMGIQKDFSRRGEAFVTKRYPFGAAVVEGTKENIKLAGLTFSVLGRLVTLKLSYKTLGGPIRIAQASAHAAKSGLSDFLYFLTFLSLQLGILNLLPIPVLDGGHLLFFGIEGISRRPVPMRARQIVEQMGFFLLIFLMLIVTLNDVDKVWGFRQLLEKIQNIF